MIKHLIKNKYARTSLIVVGILVAFVMVLLIVADIYIHNNKEQISQKIKTLLSRSLNGEITIKDVDASVLASFPYAGINVYGVDVLDSQYHKPMLKAKYVSC